MFHHFLEMKSPHQVDTFSWSGVGSGRLMRVKEVGKVSSKFLLWN